MAVDDLGAELVVIVPLWRRTTNVRRVAESLFATTPHAELLYVTSREDPAGDAMNLAVGREQARWPYRATLLVLDGPGGGRGDYATKINAGYRHTRHPHVFTGADDLVFHEGWYEAAVVLLTPPIGVVGTVDQCNTRTERGEHSTHSLVARWYADKGATVDQDHIIYNQSYWHEFTDDELIRTAMRRGAYAHAYDSVVEHVHMLRDRSLDDETYRHGREHTADSSRLFRRRRLLWGDGASSRIQYPPRVVRARKSS